MREVGFLFLNIILKNFVMPLLITTHYYITILSTITFILISKFYFL